jgi:signal recognition particle receptor subunit beta
MAFLNATTREVHCKIVYYGPGLGGKTTNVEYVFSCLSPERRGDLISLKTAGDRTLYFDFLSLDLGTIKGLRTRFHLYTVPGQPRYNATRQIVLRGADGVVFVADSHPACLLANRESFDNLRQNLARDCRQLEALPLVFQYNKRDLPDAVPLRRLGSLLNGAGHPVFEAVAIRGDGVLPTLKGIIGAVLANLTESGSEEKGRYRKAVNRGRRAGG